ncbi:hypothetical protein CaCOL14_009748 [Colletotrichum acutatum]
MPHAKLRLGAALTASTMKYKHLALADHNINAQPVAIE